MFILSKIKSAIKKATTLNKNNTVKKDAKKSAFKGIKGTWKLLIGIIVLIPTLLILGIVVIFFMIVKIPVEAIGGVVDFVSGIYNAVSSEIQQFSENVGHLFATGCYGTDETCYDEERSKREIDFVNRLKDLKIEYKTNAHTGMNTGYFKEHNGSNPEPASYSVIIDSALVVSALNYMDYIEETYFQMKQEEIGCSKLVKMGLISSENSCDNSKTGKKGNLLWFGRSLTEEEKRMGKIDPNETLADYSGYNFDMISAKVTGITDTDKCGNYNQVFNESKLTGDGMVWNTGQTFLEGLGDWIAGNLEKSQLRSLAKHMVKMDIQSYCTTEEEKDDEGNIISYKQKIRNSVLFYQDLDLFRKYLTKEYVPNLLLEKHLFEIIDRYRIDFIKEKIDEFDIEVSENFNWQTFEGSLPIEKHYLEWLEEKGILQNAEAEYLATTNTELYRLEVEKHVENIFALAERSGSYDESSGGLTCNYGGTSGGQPISSGKSGVKVQLITCDSTEKNQIKDGDLIDLEDYIKGVVYAEMDSSANVEAIKAQAIAARSFAFGRTKSWLGYNAETNIITMRSCHDDQVYCSIETGCVRLSEKKYIQGTVAGENQWKGPLTGATKERFVSAIDMTAGMVLTDGNGDIYEATYTGAGATTNFKNWANEGFDFNEILIKQYGNKLSLAGGCYFGDALEWKQNDSNWGHIKLTNANDSTMSRIGCLVTSIAVQIARSGTKINAETFSPGVFAETLKQNGAFDAYGNLNINPDLWASLAPNFKLHNLISINVTSMTELSNQLQGYLNQGYYIVLEVKDIGDGRQHWVAVTGVNGEIIYIADPSGNATSNVLSTNNYPNLFSGNPRRILMFVAR